MRLRAFILTVACVPLVVACAKKADTGASDSASMAMAAASDPSIVRQTIEAANTKFSEAAMRGDAAAMAAYYADDAVKREPGMSAWNGKSAIGSGFSQMLSTTTVSNMKFTTVDVVVGGDLAVEHGTYEMTLTPKGGKVTTDKGKYLTV